MTDAANYSKGLLSEILDFVMGQGLIPADGEVWRERRRAVVPALHRRYIESMLGMFGASALHGAAVLERQMGGGGGVGEDGGGASPSPSSSLHQSPSSSSSSSSSSASVVVEIENFFSRLTLDIIGKAVFNYDFDSLKNDDPFIQAVYTALREAEYRSTAFVPYWNFAPLRWLVRLEEEEEEFFSFDFFPDRLEDEARALLSSFSPSLSRSFLREMADTEVARALWELETTITQLGTKKEKKAHFFSFRSLVLLLPTPFPAFTRSLGSAAARRPSPSSTPRSTASSPSASASSTRARKNSSTSFCPTETRRSCTSCSPRATRSTRSSCATT